jgi:hypothetical protein
VVRPPQATAATGGAGDVEARPRRPRAATPAGERSSSWVGGEIASATAGGRVSAGASLSRPKPTALPRTSATSAAW